MPPTPTPAAPTPVNTGLFAKPGESILDYETRLGGVNSAGGDTGKGTGFGTPQPVAANLVPPSQGGTQGQPAATASTPTSSSAPSPQDAAAIAAGYSSYADAVSKLTAPSQPTTDFYNQAYSAAGLDALSKQITQKNGDLNNALGKINDNPWLDEANRVGRARNLQTLAQGDIKNLTDEYNTKLGNVHDLVSSHASDMSAADASNKAKLSFLETQAKANADQAAAETKAANTAPTTIKGANGETFQYDPGSGTFKQILPGKAVAGAGAGTGTGAGSGSGGGGSTPLSSAGQAWVTAVLNGNSTMASVPAALKTEVAEGIANQPAEAYSPIAASRFATAANRIATNYINLPQYQLTANGIPYLQRIQAAMQNPGSISDQDLLDSLTKLNTSGNAISDAQVKLITGGQSFADMANVFANKFTNGGTLSSNQRQQIQKIATAIYANYAKGYQPVYDKATAQLKAAGIPQAFWTIPDLNNLSGQSGTTGKDTSSIKSDIQYAIHDTQNFPNREALISSLSQHYGITQDQAAQQVYSIWTDNMKR